MRIQQLALVLGLLAIAGCSNESNEHRKTAEKVGGEIIYLATAMGRQSGQLAACGSPQKAQSLEAETKALIDKVRKIRTKYIEMTIEVNKELEAKGKSTLSESGSTAKSLARVAHHHERLLREFQAAKELGEIEISNSSSKKRDMACQFAESSYQQAIKAIAFASNERKKFFATAFVGEGSWSDS